MGIHSLYVFEKVIPNTSEEVIGSHKQTKTSWTSNKIGCYKKSINRPSLLAKQEYDQSSEDITKIVQAKICREGSSATKEHVK